SALPFDAETQRRTVAARKVAAVESVGENRLGVRDLEQIVSLVPPIEGVDDDVACGGCDATGLLDQSLERGTRPLADRRPPLFADVSRDLRPRWQASDLVERELSWTCDEASDRESPVLEPFRRVALILRISRVGLVPGRERIGDVASAVLARQLLAGEQQPICTHRQHIGGADQSAAHARRNERLARTSRQQHTAERGHAREQRTT